MELLDEEMEIRKLPVSVSQNLAKFFEGDDSILSLLMGNISTDLDDPSSPLRFRSTDTDSVRNHAQQHMRSPVLVLLEEWSTMGQTRPRLRHLLALLVKCHLFRAADYLAHLMGLSEPRRPDEGPAALVDIDLPHEEVLVNGIDNPNSRYGVNLDNHTSNNTSRPLNSPTINFDPETSRTNNQTISGIGSSLPLIGPSRLASTASVKNSDFIKFSKSTITPSNYQSSQNFLPALSFLQNSSRLSSNNIEEQSAFQSDNIPAISGLMLNGDSHSQAQELPAVLGTFEERSHHDSSSANTPQLSKIFDSGASQSYSRTRQSDSSSDSDE